MENSIINLDDLSNYDENTLDAISSKIVNVRLNKMEKRIEKIENDRIKDKEEMDIRIDETTQLAKDALDVGKAKAKIEEGYEGYVTQGQLGESFQLKISSNQIGDLLRIAGIAMKNSKVTKPYDNKVPKYAKIRYTSDCYGNDHAQYLWNQSECVIAIDNWLDKNDKTAYFYSCKTNGKLATYIKQLNSDFKNGLFD